MLGFLSIIMLSFMQNTNVLFLFVFFISEPTINPTQASEVSHSPLQFQQGLYDLPKNSHVPIHYDFLPPRESPSSEIKVLDCE